MDTKNFSIKEVRDIERKIDDLKKDAGGITSFLDHSDFLRLFNISVRTSLNWRSKKWLPYYQIGGKIFFKLTDIEAFLEKHFIR